MGSWPNPESRSPGSASSCSRVSADSGRSRRESEWSSYERLVAAAFCLDIRGWLLKSSTVPDLATAVRSEKIEDDRFVIRTDKPAIEVSWQVTGIRHDAFADANRIPVEEDKPETERGRYLHAEAFGQPPEPAVVRDDH